MDTGWKFPFKISSNHGRVEISSESENIRESVRIILLTEPGERRLHPEFGTRLQQFLFENNDSQTEEMIRREVRHSLQMWEKRIQNIRVEVQMVPKNQGELYIAVTYSIINRGEDDRVEIML